MIDFVTGAFVKITNQCDRQGHPLSYRQRVILKDVLSEVLALAETDTRPAADLVQMVRDKELDEDQACYWLGVDRGRLREMVRSCDVATQESEL